MIRLKLAVAAALAASVATAATGRQQPQPQPAPAPTPTVNLSGKWVTDDGQTVLLEQRGGTVNAHFEEAQPCKSGGERTNLLVDAAYSGTTLSGSTAYIACAFAEPPILQVCGLESVYGTKFDATVSADGKTISGEWLADGHWITMSGGHPVGCRPDSRYDALTGFTLTRCSSVEVKLTSADNFHINTDPKMTEIKAEVDPADDEAKWELKATFSRSAGTCSGGPDFNSPELSSTGRDYTPTFDAIYGGELKVKLESACGDVTKTEKILGDDPGKDAIQSEIGTVGSPFDPDDLKRIACQESQQRQFNPDGSPMIGDTGDFGIMQICFQRTTADLWDWKHNIATGRSRFEELSGFARRMAGYWRTGLIGRDKLRHFPRNMGPYPEATDFTEEQLRMEAIKRYNAGTDIDSGYWEWDPLSGSWVANPQGSITSYADDVIGHSPSC